jgi:hypothetical protein
MAKVTFEDGTVINFEGKPTSQDIDEAYTSVKASRVTQETQQPEQEQMVGGIFGKVPLSKYQQGERNVLGNIFERPAAANREAIRVNPAKLAVAPVANLMGGKEAIAAAINPGISKTFQDENLDNFWGKVSSKAGDIQNPVMRNAYIASQIPAGLGSSAMGLAKDTWSNPAQMLMSLAPKTPLPGVFKTPGINNVGELVASTKPAQALSRFANAPIEDMSAVKNITRTLGSAKGGTFPIGNASVDDTINTTISKAIRPSTAGKNTTSQTAKYYEKGREAVKAIFDNKDNLVFDDPTHPFGFTTKLPENLNEFSSAIEQTKIAKFNEYNALVKQASGVDVKVQLSNIAKELESVADNSVLKTIRPEIAKYARGQALRFSNKTSFTPEEAQEAVKIYNDSLQAFYKNPTYETSSRATIDAAVANNLRQALDDSILNMPEVNPTANVNPKTYQQLKNQYGALKSIEKDVNRRAIVDARKNVKGLIDFADIFSGSQILKGIISMNPAEFTSGVAKKGIGEYIKYLNNPNRMIKDMFKVMSKSAKRMPTASESELAFMKYSK